MRYIIKEREEKRLASEGEDISGLNVVEGGMTSGSECVSSLSPGFIHSPPRT